MPKYYRKLGFMHNYSAKPDFRRCLAAAACASAGHAAVAGTAAGHDGSAGGAGG